jgi:uncharacterized damage-inducible protein DinB
MQLTDFLLAELDREAERSRRALQSAPTGKFDWKPHETSLTFGYLAGMVATIPMWIAGAVTLNEIDIKPKDGPNTQMGRMDSSEELLKTFEKTLADARKAIQGTTDEFLKTSWRLLETGKTVMETERGIVIADTLNHWVHHRGQMTVYLRLMGAKVPALYGPSADDHRFQ